MNLEKLEKKNIFEVPEGYFDKLPLIIQERVAVKERRTLFASFNVSLRYALPVIVFATVSIFIYQNYFTTSSPEKILESISSETLIAYLGESEISEEEIIQTIDVNSITFQHLPDQAIELNELTNKDIDKLAKDIENEYF